MVLEADNKKLERFRAGNSDEKEEEFVYAYFSEHENDRDFQKLIWDDFNEFLKDSPNDKHDLTYLLDHIHHVIHIKESKKKRAIAKEVYLWFSVTAAALLVSLLVIVRLWSTEPTPEIKVLAEESITSTIYAPLGSRINFNLPDSTEVWLNSGSSLEYSLPFINNRKVTVLGEAYFNVTHDEKNPFEITTGKSKIKVLGTKFNLSAYPEEKYVEVVLEDGTVEFSTPQLNSTVVMKKNERLILNDEKITVSTTDATKYTVWVQGKIVFRGDPMDEVARRLSRWYNIDVELVDKELNNFVIRGIFEDDSLEEVLHFLSMTSPIKYQIIDSRLLDNDAVQKKRVLLYLKK